MFRHTPALLKFVPYLLLILSFLLAYATWQPLAENQSSPRIAALVMLIFGLVDWILLSALPRLGLSFGSVGLPWFLILCMRVVILLIFVGSLAGIFRLQPAIHTPQTVTGGLLLWSFVNLAASAVIIYSLYFEPFDLRVTQVRLTSPAFFADRPLRIIQLADIHIERITKREREILSRVNALQPDLIVLTGDYVNYDYVSEPRSRQETRTFLSQLHAPYGVYAIPGSASVDSPEAMSEIFAGLEIAVLNDQAQGLPIGSGVLYIAGVKIDRSGKDRTVLSTLMQQAPPEAITLLLYHTPDLIEAAAENNVNLYLAGHTHGGQVRLPFIGALITLSAYGRKYASGQHRLGPTTLYTSRGLGMEGLHLPRARLLCPPEMVVVELGK